MKMGTAHKQNIAIQHRYWNTHGGYTRAKNPVSFEKWFLVCLRKCEKKGADFTFVCPGLVRICWPGKVPILRTVQDFEREYNSEYLSKF
jgi:hypothetical protein